MHHLPITHVENPGPLTLTARLRITFIAMTVLGLLAFGSGLAVNPDRAWNSYLVNYFLFLCFALGGLFFTALQHAVNATWVIAVRRVSEGFTAYLPAALVLFVGVVVSLGHLYPWANAAEFHDPAKHKWLSPVFFSARHVVCLLVWIFFARKIVNFSLKQDETGNVVLSRKATIWSIVFMPVFAITFALTAFDLIMSLEPHWYSTIFGVYCFAGLFQSSLALITLMFLWMKRGTGPLARVATPSHVKDLGTYIFAFTIFMCYIGFSQYMLIWYANLPEETSYFLKRQTGGWQYLFVALPILKFAIPFLGLLSQAMKKSERWLMLICWVIIIGQFLDIYWMVLPASNRRFVPIGWIEIGTLLGFAGIFGWLVSRFYSRHSLLAARDPRLLESVNWRFWE